MNPTAASAEPAMPDLPTTQVRSMTLVRLPVRLSSTNASAPGQGRGPVEVRSFASSWAGLVGASVLALGLLLIGSAADAAVTVSNVRAAQRPGTSLVDLYYDLAGIDSAPVLIAIELSDDGGTTYATLDSNLSGDLGPERASGSNRHIVWNAGVDRPQSYAPHQRFRVTAMSLPTDTAYIPAGSFVAGSPTTELGRPPARLSNGEISEDQHMEVIARAFVVQKTEVTWQQWNDVRDWALAHGYDDLPTGENGSRGDDTGHHPVTKVNWFDAIKWLNAMSEKSGLRPCYTIGGAVCRSGEAMPTCDFRAPGYRLPREYEWEYACRAGTTTAFYSGDCTHYQSSPLDPKLDQIGWYGGNSDATVNDLTLRTTHRAGLKSSNTWGLFDMSGNVSEWCWELGEIWPSRRKVRGGSFNDYASHCRSAYRQDQEANGRSLNIGFRPVRSL